MRHLAATLAGAAFVVSAILVGVTTAVEQPAPAEAHHNTQLIICWRTCSSGAGQNNVRFTNYDYRQAGWGAVDWPTGFVFTNNASVNRVKDGLCSGTTHPWKFCQSGGPQYMRVEQRLNPGDGCCAPGVWWDSDSGRKRFSQNCSSTEWTAHIRLYAPTNPSPTDVFYDHVDGYMVVGTTHLDYQDKNGCAGRSHGGTEAAENWMIGTMSSVPGWNVSYNTFSGLQNANSRHIVQRTIGGASVPHEYVNDGLSSIVEIPL